MLSCVPKGAFPALANSNPVVCARPAPHRRAGALVSCKFGVRDPIHIIGAGLAGSEAAWQIARRGIACVLHEMRPVRSTPAHRTDRMAELVCSNSLKSNTPGAASWLLKEELRRSGSLLLKLADECAVPGGAALAVDRQRFSESV